MAIKTTTVNGIKMRYQILPNEGKETIIFLHYGGATLAIWNGVIPYFQENYQIVAPDLRSHGFTDKTDDNTIDTMARDIFELMEKLKIKTTHIVGSSLGADVALGLAANYPKKILSLSLDGGFYDLVGPYSKEQHLTKEQIEKAKTELKDSIISRGQKIFNSKQEMIDSKKANWEKYFPWSDIAQKAVEDDIIKGIDGKFSSTQTPENIWNYCKPLYDFSIFDYYKKIDSPLLILPDEKEIENTIVQQNIVKVQNMMQNSKVVVIPGSVHAYTCLIKTEEFCKTIQDFLDEIKSS